ncbi:Phosphoserine phosphatase RsbU [Actinomadura rubteroloni]|uniref:Phosphoserine phosphatase RsbU n=1 Tax=Actinomadura rubteroloni TaxID=1926885 RepID=A0A2P4UFA1_9ACTN|nr:SpoIIE family protein phosphatase [Actinomadura rubteroloni]POM23692.1 Phosphoserine phosphatase RsbU [Actinomadura rubteroloni]
MDGQTVSATFPSAAESVADARRFVRTVLTDWGMPAAVDDAVLATSELATNAVTYAGTSFEVCCARQGDEVRIEVRDLHPTRAPEMPGINATSGRGLPSIARLATAWGVTYDRRTKGIWFRIPAGGGQDLPVPRLKDAGRSRRRAAPKPAETDPAAPATALTIAGDRLLRSPAAREALEDAAASAREALKADAAAVLLTERDGTLVVGAATGLPLDAPAGAPSVVDLGPEARAGRAWITADAADPLAAALHARSLAAAPLDAEGRLTGFLVATAAVPDRFSDADGVRLGRLAGELSLALEKARIGELERSWRGWLSFVAEASDLLAGTLDQERTMALVAQLVVPRLATWCAIYSAGDGDPGRLAYVWHADENRADALRDLLTRAGTVPEPEAPGPWNALADAPDAVRAAARETADDVAHAFPLIARGRRIGSLVIGRPPGDRFPRSAIELAEELSRRAALAVDNARLYSEQTTMSSALQRSLLPPGIPDIPGLEVAVVYEPAGEGHEVGGDFYDVFPSGDQPAVPARWRFAIGDVCGTGPEAAAVTGLARHALRILAAEDMTVPDVLTRLNRLILGEGERARLLTLLHGEITPRPRRDGVSITLTSAGHPPPLVLDPDGNVHEAAGPQPLLGVFDGVDFHTDAVELRSGQVLLCVTDGVTERRSGARLLGDGQGLERLLAGCTGLSAGAVAARIQRAVRDFGPEPSNDDVALIVLRAS